MPEVHAPNDIDGSEPGHAHGVAGMARGEAACIAIPNDEQHNTWSHGIGQVVGAAVFVYCWGQSPVAAHTGRACRSPQIAAAKQNCPSTTPSPQLTHQKPNVSVTGPNSLKCFTDAVY
jgi:hypothetical protein